MLRLTKQHGVRRVVEGTQHARDVAQCAALDAPFAQRPRRLALEIDDHEIIARVKYLPEVIVAMRTDAKSCNAAVQNAPDPLLEFVFTRQQFLRCRNAFPAPPQQLERTNRLRADVLVHRTLIMRRNRFGSECRYVIARRKREMHLCGAASEYFGVGEIKADGLLRDLRQWLLGDSQQRF